MKHVAPISALVAASALLGLQILGGLEYTEGGSLYTRSSMIAAMVTLAVLPVFLYLAIRARQWFVAAAFVVSFAAFLAYSLPATTGRTGEIKETKATAAADLALIKAELASITKTLGWARPDKISECAGAPDPLPPNGWPKCRAKTGTVAALEDRQAKLEAEIKSGKAVETGDLGSDIWAWALAPLGVTSDTVRKVSVLAFAIGLDFVIWSLVAFGSHGYIRGNSGNREPTPSETAQTSFYVSDLPATRAIVVGADDEPGNGGERVLSKAEALLDLTRRMASGETVPSQETLAESWGVHPGTASKWLKGWRQGGIVPVAVQRVGRCHRLVAAE